MRNEQGDLIKGGSVLVTGAAGGAGRVIAERFADSGASVSVCDVSADAVAQLNAERPDIHAYEFDVSNANEIERFFAELRKADRHIDVLINNVGISGPTAALEDVRLTDWERVILTNLTSYFLFAQGVAAGMKKRSRGLIVNISSTCVKTGLPMRMPYVVAKSGVSAMAMTLARELGPFGVRVNSIMPGAIRGDRIERVFRDKAAELGVSVEDYERDALKYISLRTMVDPDDIASMCLFLASAEGARITGQELGVDGNVEYEA